MKNKRKSAKVPACLLKTNNLVVSLVFSVLFALVFLVVYSPFSETYWLSNVSTRNFAFTLLFVSVSIIILVGSRVGMFFLSKRMRGMRWTDYVLWLFGEIFLIALYYSLLSLKMDEYDLLSYLRLLGRSIIVALLALGIPYVMSALWFILVDTRRIAGATLSNSNVSRNIINFFDNNGNLKLSVSLDSLYYIKAEDNNVIVYFSKNGSISNFSIRCKLQNIEYEMKNTPVKRCHRAYIVNTLKVKVLRSEADNFYIDFDIDGLESIPVSRTYSNNIVREFSGV